MTISALITLLVFLVAVAGVFLAAFLVFDRIVSLEYDAHRSQWQADGTPRGYFWSPKEYGAAQSAGKSQSELKSQSLAAFPRMVLKWLFSTPKWIKEDSTAGKLLMRFRLYAFLGNAALLVGFEMLMLSARAH